MATLCATTEEDCSDIFAAAAVVGGTNPVAVHEGATAFRRIDIGRRCRCKALIKPMSPCLLAADILA